MRKRTKKKNMFIEGKKIILRVIELNDFPRISKWLNDSEVTRSLFYGRLPINLEQMKGLVKSYINAPEHIIFMVIDKKTKRVIGFAGIFEIDMLARNGGLVALIGEKQFWNKGYGLEIIAVLTHYGFDRLNLNMIYLGMTRADNKGAIRMYEMIGYKFGGVRRQYLYRNSRYYDAAFMDLLREEYYGKLCESYLKQFFPLQKNNDK